MGDRRGDGPTKALQVALLPRYKSRLTGKQRVSALPRVRSSARHGHHRQRSDTPIGRYREILATAAGHHDVSRGHNTPSGTSGTARSRIAARRLLVSR